MNKRLVLGLSILLLSFSILLGQEIKINRIDGNEDKRRLLVDINATDEYGNPLFGSKEDFKILERRGDGENRELFIEQVLQKDEANTDTLFSKPAQQVTIYFLLDVSGSMEGVRLTTAKRALQETLLQNNLPKRSTFFSYFCQEVSPAQYLTRENYDEVVAPVGLCPHTNIYGALDQGIEAMNTLPGQKVLILIADGRHTQGGPGREYVLDRLRELDKDFYVFPIGIGTPGEYKVDFGFLEEVAAATPNEEDVFTFEDSPENLSQVLRSVISNFTSNFTLLLRAPRNDYRYSGEQRTLTLVPNEMIGSASVSKDFTLGGSATTLNLNPNVSFSIWLPLFVGLGLILLLLAVLWFLLPIFTSRRFKNKYVKRYAEVQQAGIREQNPITLEPFQGHEMVVVKCSHITPYEAWIEQGNCCLYYPSQCQEGVIDTGSKNFFQQQGRNKQFNWLWFGALGGFLAWGLFAWMKNMGDNDQLEWYKGLLSNWFDVDTLMAISNSVFLQTITGFALGLCLGLALAITEELGHSGKFSVGKVLLRGLIGALIGWCIFFLESLLFSYFSNGLSFFGNLISWLLFGAAVGWVVTTVSSTIEWKSGLYGGAIAGLFGAVVYLIADNIISDPDYSKLIGFIPYGAILGGVIFKVIDQLEDFELEYLSPKEWAGRKNPISKWLKAGQTIFIGADDDCDVLIKWSDRDPAVQPKHAELSYSNGVVFIRPLGEVLLNGRVIPMYKSTALSKDDVIQLGRGSISTMKFLERKSFASKQRVINRITYQQSAGAATRMQTPTSTPQSGGSGAIKIRPRS